MPEQDLLYFEDMSPGTIFPLGPKDVTADEIIAFAMEFDPQPMHIDAEAGAASILGGLAASGWHTCAMMMRMMADSYLLRTAAEGAPGIDHVRWRKPVLAGDVLSGETRVLEARESRSRPGIGIVSLRHELRNQIGDTVIESENPVMVRLRPQEGGEA
ncbi:MaoC family dehydratase [Hoeflea sp. G2-23]|uniref:MaoC family dehydratase n=1 Tax=Hoeflea algicola TaxID=2983763 RepID=A0ABT3Z9K8_9HYPH|nr:MaoC family dehydratase [Hoeflea algicola]MCY0148024.1 MaoC family dehydratase [Hoeflea algicola]